MIANLRDDEQHKHSNGHGWVADTARVEDSVYVGPHAIVYGKAEVTGRVRIEDFAPADEKNVREAIMKGLPAGRVLASNYTDDPRDPELRIAFDFDGVIIDDEAEQIYQIDGLEKFQAVEVQRALEPHNPGPLKRLLEEIGRIHQREIARAQSNPTHQPTIRIAIITSRNAPAHKRMVTTLRSWGIEVDETFFLGGMDKGRILMEFKPHLFFDDQMTHVGPVSGTVPSVHVPFGQINKPDNEDAA